MDKIFKKNEAIELIDKDEFRHEVRETEVNRMLEQRKLMVQPQSSLILCQVHLNNIQELL